MVVLAKALVDTMEATAEEMIEAAKYEFRNEWLRGI